MRYYELISFRRMKKWFFFFFRNFGISLIKMKPVTQPWIPVSSSQWKDEHFRWISFIYKGLMILALLMVVIRKLGLHFGMRSSCVCSKDSQPGCEEGHVLCLQSSMRCFGTLLSITAEFSLNSWHCSFCESVFRSSAGKSKVGMRLREDVCGSSIGDLNHLVVSPLHLSERAWLTFLEGSSLDRKGPS